MKRVIGKKIKVNYPPSRTITHRTFNEDNQLHSIDDSPSVVWSNGALIWHKNGLKHRENGLPAMVLPNGHQEFYLNGEMIKIIEGLNETDCSNMNCDQRVYSAVIEKHAQNTDKPYRCGVCGTEFKKNMRRKS